MPFLTRLLVVLAVPVALAGCGQDRVELGPGQNEPRMDDAQRYQVTATVLESPEHGPQLCLGGVQESLPPSCGGPGIVGWDWDAVDDKESVGGTTWGTYTMVGTWDGTRFSLVEPPRPPEPQEGRQPDLTTPCDPPRGGWQVVEPATATERGLQAGLAYARSQPDFAGAWVDQSINPDVGREPVDEREMNDPTRLVLNLRFTGDLERHEAAVRARWGGALCITQARHALRDLEAIRDEVQRELDVLVSYVDETRGVVHVTVAVADEQLRRALDERYGEGVVEIESRLRRVE